MQAGLYLYLPRPKKKVLSLIVAPIESLKEKRADLDIALFGYPEWLTQVPEYLNEFYKLNTYLYSPILCQSVRGRYEDVSQTIPLLV